MAHVRFSGHAKRRMKLYGIGVKTVVDMLPSTGSLGRHEVVCHAAEHRLPIKVVYECRSDETLVITAYPLRKARQ